MTTRSVAGQPSPLGLRLVHAAVFLAFAAGVVVTAVPEWQHLSHALGQPFHAGAPPRWLVLVGSLLAAAGTLRLAWGLVRGRTAPLWASGAILLAVVGTLAAGAPRGLEETRSESAANLDLLRVARRVHLAMVQELQAHAGAPVDVEAWRQALTRAGAREGLVRTRTFRPVPPQVLWLPSEQAVPEALVPGALLVHVAPEGVGFSVRVVGLEHGRPALLKDDQGATLVLRGLYNPDLPPPPEPSLPDTLGPGPLRSPTR
ncbi:hypothetical protein JY651_08990 [Pyxidicoccus parkwayensis]|uniref:Uncharacterized protein n=1 Tax=Pyxidicoccus parkwayensis TaxID=2813578 RepID=A0ABX7P3K0_9BACT|nr:hypothetical protein [Pyxidicoccus parkwaysis]QSQ25048.1 hypothetical protein JY651_08990 [Pyxidicoccus parkwaysis]